MKTTEGVKCDICGRFYSDDNEKEYPQDVIAPNDPTIWNEPGAVDHVCGLCYKRIMELKEQLSQEYIRELAESLKEIPISDNSMDKSGNEEPLKAKKLVPKNGTMGRPRIDIDMAKIEKLRNEGQTLADIAKEIGIARSTLDRRLSEWRNDDISSTDKENDSSENATQKVRQKRPPIIIDLDKLMELKKEGKSNTEIADILGVSLSTIEKRIRDLTRGTEPDISLDGGKDNVSNEEFAEFEEETLLSAELDRRDITDEGNDESQCPYCGASSIMKNGIRELSTGITQQRYKCIDCEKRFVMDPKKRKFDQLDDEVRRFVIGLKDKGLSLRKIEKELESEYGLKIGRDTIRRHLDELSSAEGGEQSGEIACPECGNKSVIRKGIRKLHDGENQRYICKNCEKSFVLESMRGKIDDKMSSLILALHSKGLSSRKISKRIEAELNANLSHVSILQHIKEHSNSSSARDIDEKALLNPNPKVNERRARRRENLTDKGQAEYLQKLEKEDEYMDRHLQEIESSDTEKKLCPFCRERYVEDPAKDHCDICETAFEMNYAVEARGK